MKIFEANISTQVQSFFANKFNSRTTLAEANELLHSVAGIKSFFETKIELDELKQKIFIPLSIVEESERAEYGDFQTNLDLALKVAEYVSLKINEPEIIIEPTSGKGNFVIASLQVFRSLKRIYAIEIYKPYVWECKFSILEFYLNNPEYNKPEISVLHFNIFDFDFKIISESAKGKNVLIIGNPPWVTNSMLGSLNSVNLPTKSNFKKLSGLDAMTGKGNFDIAEYITLMLLDNFHKIDGNVALLIKNSVVKNIVFDQKKNNYSIQSLEKLTIDAKKEFNVSVEASLFFCQLNSKPSFVCEEIDFYYKDSTSLKFGWIEDKFVSNINAYIHSEGIDGVCPFEWRQGLKHDCSNVMEFERGDEGFFNTTNGVFELETDLVYGLLKSSDLKSTVVKSARKFTIVTQKRIGQDTSYIEKNLPKTYNYLHSNQAAFDNRKSSIYKGKPPYSIFGIGDYSFKPFKIVISGLYKTFHFTLVLPDNGKPLMLDDTCYMLGFETIDYAAFTLILLNSKATRNLLESITFSDAKRIFTKDVLMRIDLYKLSLQFTTEQIKQELEVFNGNHQLDIKADGWLDYLKQIKPFQSVQTLAFG